MKYKNRKHAKRKYKHTLLATVATMTLGINILGSTTSAFAADYVIPMEDSKTLEKSPENSQERTKELIEKGTKNFKEYYNIKYVPIQFYEWESKGENQSDIMYEFADAYTDYIKADSKLQGSFSLVVGFTANNNYGIAYGGTLPQAIGLDGADSIEPIPLITIKDVPSNNLICSIESTIKHELSHAYSVPDDHEGVRNSVMSSKPGVTEWSSTEMEIIRKNRDRYKNHTL